MRARPASPTARASLTLRPPPLCAVVAGSRRMSPADQESSYRAIECLIATYAELVDDGDFAAVGRLLAEASFTGGAGAVTGGDAIEKTLRDIVILHDDGTPRTKHVTTNLAIEVDEDAPEQRCPVRTSPRYRRCLTLRSNPSSAANAGCRSNAVKRPQLKRRSLPPGNSHGLRRNLRSSGSCRTSFTAPAGLDRALRGPRPRCGGRTRRPRLTPRCG
jgi:hypothetical protein